MLKIITVHGLGGSPNWILFKMLEKGIRDRYEFIHLDYSDCYCTGSTIEKIRDKMFTFSI
ncbi:MAG TPA: hypothetical protein EYH09_01945 [Candidatus Nanopusillus sp.]|nr:hypothetical protein [Candidatus Nanopusillus sp.]